MSWKQIRNFLLIALGDPTFKMVDCVEVKDLTHHDQYDLCLSVYYTEGNLTDYEIVNAYDTMALQRVNETVTVFEGSLLKEQSKVTVSLKNTSDPDDIEVYFMHTVYKLSLIDNIRCRTLIIRLCL